MISPNISPKELSIWDRLRRLDFHPKTKDDFRVRTAWGGATSMIALASMTYLFLTELSYSMEKDIVDHMYVNTSRDTRIPFNFNITFPLVSCSLLSADAMDPLGNAQEGLDSHVYKTRLNLDGTPMSERTKHKLEKTVKDMRELRGPLGEEEERPKEGSKEGEAAKCGNCYGAGEEGECCNTCESVKEAYRKKGWAFIGLNVDQCKEEIISTGLISEEPEEGCNIHGSLLLSQDSGNVHFAPGEQLRHSGMMNVADLVMFTFLKFNISHEIHELSVGDEFPGFKSPLSNQKRSVADGYGMYQYYLKIVPTVYKYLSGPPTISNQYAVTEHVRHINPGSNRGLPGVWFFYDTSPVQVEFQERRKGYLAFLTSVCAIVGGIFSVFGVMDGLIHNLTRKTRARGGAPGGT